jgi:hypothetical protein
MSLARPQNRTEFKQNILTRLGAPVLEINVSDEQLDICIEEAFQYFNERSHYDGNERVYISIDLASQNVINNFTSYHTDVDEKAIDGVVHRTTSRRQSNFILLPEDVTGVVEVMRTGSGMAGGIGGILPPGFGFPGMIGGMMGNACDTTGFGLIQYFAFQGYMSLIQFLMYPPKMYRFNRRTHRISIDGDLRDLGRYLVLDCLVKPSPDVFPDLWTDSWLKLYCQALVKKAWGQNLSKFSGVQLPGGITLNGDKIYNDAVQELDTIRQRFALDEQDPPLDVVG